MIKKYYSIDAQRYLLFVQSYKHVGLFWLNGFLISIIVTVEFIA